jgi:hypothetical protein
MKKLVFFLFIIFVSVPVEAQFALKGGVSYAKNEVSNYVVTGQFYKELLVLSADLIMPTEKIDNLSGSGRIGLGFGDRRIRFAGDLVATYEDQNWRCGCGVEANLKLFSVLGAFARWSRTFPIAKNGDHDEVIWGNGRSEFSLGIVIDLGRSY